MAITVEEAVRIIEDVASLFDADTNNPNVRYFSDMAIILKGQGITYKEWDKRDIGDSTLVLSEGRKEELMAEYREIIDKAYDAVRSRASRTI